MRKNIFFGFYKGLGDFITDAHIISVFIREGFDVSVAVSSWFSNLAKFMLPAADIIPYKSWKDLTKLSYNYRYIFLTPNYLHPFSLEKRALWLYLSKLYLVKKIAKYSFIIHPEIKELFFHYFQIKRTFLDEHFYLMSLYLLRRYFPDLPFKSLLWNKTLRPEIKRVIFFPFSGNPNKDYPVDKYIFIAEKLQEKYGLKDIFFFTTERDLNRLSHIKDRFHVYSKSLIEIAKFLKETDLVISGDTGPAHLSAYYSANLIVLYGYTKASKYKPLGTGRIETITSKTGKLKDIPEGKILKSIEENFLIRGRFQNGEENAVHLHSNI